MKFLLAVFVVISFLVLSYMTIHAYEGTYKLECDVVEENGEGLIEEVYASSVTASSHPEAPGGIFGARTEAGGLLKRRDLQAPLWAAVQ